MFGLERRESFDILCHNRLYLYMPGNFACFFSRLWIVFELTLKKNLSWIPSECQTVRIQIRPDVVFSRRPKSPLAGKELRNSGVCPFSVLSRWKDPIRQSLDMFTTTCQGYIQLTHWWSDFHIYIYVLLIYEYFLWWVSSNASTQDFCFNHKSTKNVLYQTSCMTKYKFSDKCDIEVMCPNNYSMFGNLVVQSE